MWKRCRKTLLLFELVYKALAVAVFYPFFLALFSWTLKSAGIKYLTNGYISKYLSNPVTILSVILLVLLIAMYTFFEKCCMSVLLEAAHAGKKIALISMLSGGVTLFVKKVHKRNLLMFLYEIFLFPFSNIIIFGFVLTNISLPEYVTNVIGSRKRLYIVLLTVCVLLFVFAIRRIFTTNCLLYGDKDFTGAYKDSIRLIKKKAFRTLLFMVFWNMMVGIFVGIIFLLITGIVVAGVFLLNMIHTGIALYLTIIKTAKTIITLMLVLISSPASYMIITGMYFRYQDEAGESGRICAVTEGLIEKPAKWKRGAKTAVAIGTFLSLVLICIYVYHIMEKNPFDRVELLQIPKITAHRGSSDAAPENTMAAFYRAVEDMADYIELDVHLTADGVAVVVHDTSLMRTAGLRQNVWQMSLDAIERLDAGGWFSEEYKGEKIPTLEEVILSVGDDIRLNIEIKSSKRERGLAEEVVRIIKKYEFEDRCIVTSTDDSILQTVKQLDGDIRTGYVLSAAYGAYYSIGYVDIISINYNFVNKAMVDAIHHSGKEVHVWTVNSPGIIRTLANMGVDNIITDNPVMARSVVYSRYTVQEIINILDYIFRRNSYDGI